MKLFGNVAKTKHTFERWYLEMPEFWCKDPTYIKDHPYPSLPEHTWGEIDTDLYKFFTLDIEVMDFEKVLDLRGARWREKLSTFIMWFGNGWSSQGGLWSGSSPLDQILFLGNYNVLSYYGYRWTVLNHGPDKEGNFVELWYYVNQLAGPDKFYMMEEISSKELL